MAKPNLLIVGAAKSGTTSMHNYLNQHHDVFMCAPKEPHFLINKEIGIERISVGVSEKTTYEKLFLDGENLKYRGESSVMYLMYPEIVIPKIKEYLGNDIKIIIMLRNPVERAYSGYQHVKRYNIKEDISEFRDAWDISEERYFSNPDMTPASRYKELGMYYKQVKSYLKNFNVHIIIYDDYKLDIQNEMNKVFDFLDINRMEINFDRRHMVGGWRWKNQRVKSLMTRKNPLKSFLKIIIPFKKVRKIIRTKIQDRNIADVLPISMEDEKMLKEFYKDDVRHLSKLLERDLNYWTK